jgi:release factor glutamine methyltransferase
MQFPNKRVYFGKYMFDLYENVYEPAEDSFFFAENLDVKKGFEVLDVGAGCGILGILTAEKAASVVAVDLNPYSIHCAKDNSTLNNVKNKMTFIQASLLTAFKENTAFDLILFNSPYLPSNKNEMETWIERSWAGGTNGRQVIDQFISEAPPHLKASGRILMMQSTLANAEETIRKFEGQNLKARIMAECKLPFFETLTLVEAKINL